MCNLLYNLINISTSCIIIDKSNIIKQLLNASMCRPMEVFLGLKEPFVNYFCFLKFNPFHATDRFWYHLKKSENLRFFYVFWGYQKRSVAWNWLILHKALLLVHCGSCFFRCNLLLLRFCALMLFALWRKCYFWCKDVSGDYLQQYLSRFNSCYQQLY